MLCTSLSKLLLKEDCRSLHSFRHAWRQKVSTFLEGCNLPNSAGCIYYFLSNAKHFPKDSVKKDRMAQISGWRILLAQVQDLAQLPKEYTKPYWHYSSCLELFWVRKCDWWKLKVQTHSLQGVNTKIWETKNRTTWLTCCNKVPAWVPGRLQPPGPLGTANLSPLGGGGFVSCRHS